MYYYTLNFSVLERVFRASYFLSSALLNSAMALVSNSAVAGLKAGCERRRERHPEHTVRVSKNRFSTQLELFGPFFGHFYLKNLNNLGIALVRHLINRGTDLVRYLRSFSTALLWPVENLTKS